LSTCSEDVSPHKLLGPFLLSNPILRSPQDFAYHRCWWQVLRRYKPLIIILQCKPWHTLWSVSKKNIFGDLLSSVCCVTLPRSTNRFELGMLCHTTAVDQSLWARSVVSHHRGRPVALSSVCCVTPPRSTNRFEVGLLCHTTAVDQSLWGRSVVWHYRGRPIAFSLSVFPPVRALIYIGPVFTDTSCSVCLHTLPLLWDFRFSRQRVWRWLPSVLRRLIWLKFTDVSDVLAASIIWTTWWWRHQQPRRQLSSHSESCLTDSILGGCEISGLAWRCLFFKNNFRLVSVCLQGESLLVKGSFQICVWICNKGICVDFRCLIGWLQPLTL
jgi:hypothetical protein